MDRTGLDQHMLPDVIDRRAAETPEKAFASIPKDSSDLSKGFKDISYRVFANAVNKAAWFGEAPISNGRGISYV